MACFFWYVATVGARKPSQTVWEESQLSLVFHTLGRKVATEAFPATLVPRITEGLNLWCYPRASFKMNVINGERVGDSLGVIYLAMDSRGFVSEGNASKRKRYSALQVESAVVAESVSLETKLCLIEAAVQSGFADTAKAQALLAQALDATCKTLEEKLAATEKMIQGQAASLSAKLALIETAVKEGFADDQKRQELLQKAVETLRGTQEEKLAAVEAAVESQGSSLDAKLNLMAKALENGIGDQNAAVGQLKSALKSSLGTLGIQLTELRDQTLEQLAAISGKLTTEQLAKAFKSVADTIEGKIQSEGELLAALQDMVRGLQQVLAPTA